MKCELEVKKKDILNPWENFYFIYADHIEKNKEQLVYFLNLLSISALTVVLICFHQTSGKLLEMGLKTRQSTLLLKKEIEVKKVQGDMEIKRRQFSQRMEKCRAKENELKVKQQQVIVWHPFFKMK